MTTQGPIANRPALCLGATLTLCTALSAALLTTTVSAQEAAVGMYKCEQGGVVSFSDEPCGPDEHHIEVDYANPNNSQAGAEQAQASKVAESELLDTEIQNAQEQLDNLQAERDARIAALRQQRFDGSEQLDLQAWQAEMNAKIEATVQQYQSRIDTESARLSDLLARRAALAQP